MSITSSSLLFTPLRLRHLTLNNRLVLPAITTLYNEGEILSDKDVHFYEARAKGGAGLIITGMLSIISSRGSRFKWPGIHDVRFIPQM